MCAFVLVAAFWIGAGILGYTFIGYRLLIGFLARLREPAVSVEASAAAPLPQVCAVVVAHNEGARIARRIENLLASDYPGERLRVLLVSDGSTDDTVASASALNDRRVEVLPLAGRSGKAAGINAALQRATAELLVFTDARQRFSPDTIRRLAGHFRDPRVGAVSGSLEIDRSASGLGQGVDAYWRFEKAIRADEARWDSCIGCTGAVYAVRRELCEPIPADTVLDDVVIPMQIAARGFRILHDPAALAFDPQALEPAAERLRKRRTLAGNFQMLFRHPHWVVPWRHRLWWQLISHKYLRLLAPVLLAQTLLTSLALSAAPFYRAAFFGQCAFYAIAAIGLARPSAKSRLFALPAAFVFLNLATLRAFALYLTGREFHRWR